MPLGNGKLHRIVPVLENPGRCDSTSTGNNAENEENIQTSQPQPNSTSHQPTIPPPVVTATTPLLPESHEAISPSIGPPPAVFTVAFDDEQLANDPDKVLVELPKTDIRRSRSENEVLNSPPTNVDADYYDAHCTVSTEYPYVLHTFEIVGNHRSAPDILEHDAPVVNFSNRHHSLDDVNHHASNHDHPSTDHYVNVEGSCSNLELEGDLSYSYIDKEMVVQDTPPKSREDKDDNDASQDCDEFPSTWISTSQSTFGHGKPTTLSNGINDTLGGQLLRSSHESHAQSSPMMATNPLQLVTSNHNSKDVSNDSAVLTGQSPIRYMKLLAATKEDPTIHRYTSLQFNATEVNELSHTYNDHDFDTERAHPAEWYKQ